MSISRRQFNALGLGAPVLVGGCSTGSLPAYDEAVQELWRHGRVDRSDAAAVKRELVRYATLAPSSHNTQCWRFGIEPQAITLLPDYSRRCPAVDPDDHHLFVSLGCAAENLAQAASAHGLMGHFSFEPSSGVLRTELEPSSSQASVLFDAIPRRQSTRGDYDAKPLSGDELRLLEQAASVGGVQILLLTERPARERLLEFVLHANSAQMKDAAFVEELKSWIRFSADDAIRFGDGLYTGSSGNPTMPAWLGRLMFGLFFTERSENDKYARQVRSSAGIAIFVGPGDDKASWLQVGRAFQRFALQATAMGVRTAHLNQPVEVAASRREFARAFGFEGRRPDLVVRFGRGPALPPSLRRPLEAVLA